MSEIQKGTPEQSRKGNVARLIISIVLPLIILAGGVFTTMHFMRTSPKAVPRNKPVYDTLVKVEPVRLTSQRTTINGMGAVVAAREVDLKSRVGGDVVYVNEELVPGGVLAEGQTVVKIDPADYRLRVTQLESEVAKAEADLTLEMGNQRVARKEFELLGEEAGEEEKSLMLRIPQLKQKEAALDSSRSKLAEAELDLQRTTLKAPFESVVQAKSVELGSRVTESTPVARLIGTDSFWVQVGIPVEKLDWIVFPDRDQPDRGATARIYPRTVNGEGSYRIGRVIRLAADLEEGGRMAKVIVEVDDPLCLLPENKTKPVLFLGSYVGVEIEGTTLEQVYPLNRAYLRDNSTIWMLSDDSTLEIREVAPVFKGPSTVLLKDQVRQGEKVIVSNIGAPVAGMKLRLEGQSGGRGMRGAGGKGSPPGSPEKKTGVMPGPENQGKEPVHGER